MKLKSRGIFLLICVLIVSVLLLINHKLLTFQDGHELIKHNSDVINPGNAHDGHLNVFRKDLDESNYKSESLKSEKAKSGQGGSLKDAGNIGNGEEPDGMEESAMRKIREAIRQSPIFKKKESLMKLVEAIQVQANNEHFAEEGLFAAPEKETFRIGWFGIAGNDTDAIKLLPGHLNFLKRIRPFKKRFKNAKPATTRLYEKEDISNLTSSQAFHKAINQYSLYQTQDKNIDRLLHDLHTQPIVGLEQHAGGTQIKFILTFNDGSRAMFKPMRFPREQETLPDHYYWSDYERHNAEIAAFHLDRVLGFNRVPPTVGRILNITTQIRRYADDDLEPTFFYSPAGNLCFYGQCDYYCDSSHAVCGHPDVIEGSVMAYLPSSNDLGRKTWRSPWKRTYSKRKRADWEHNPRYCEKLRKRVPYNTGRRLLDLMDLAVFDFLIGNLDRHHYETFSNFGNFTNPMHLDNGRAFGRPGFDDLSIIAPVTQCCLIRHSTLTKLLSYNEGPASLSDVMRTSLNADPIAPILLDKHFKALDRRVKIILKILSDCIKKASAPYKAVVDDGF